MVPGALRAHLDHIAGKVVAALRELGELGGALHATPRGRQARSEREGDQHDVGVLTDRALAGGLLADVAGSSQQLGMGVAHVEAGQPATAEFGEGVAAGEAVIDLPVVLNGASENLGSQ